MAVVASPQPDPKGIIMTTRTNVKRAVVFRTRPKGLGGIWWQFVAEGAPRIAAGGLYPCGTKDCRGPIFRTHEAASDAARSEGYGEVRVSDSEAVLP